ncbi:YcaO-like family protein [uncultured Roseibium sp.]|uniref:YcaO-like family protein n=1 Tax=uncultured Roseibium sp. TaxID=1936171 RepID=UPI002603757C|nr:YcaO-like family protein [uncultured Roseibium sp.]
MEGKLDGSKNPPEWRDMPEEILSGLLRVGLLRLGSGAENADFQIANQSLSLFFPFLISHDVKIVPMDIGSCPVAFCTGLLNLIDHVEGEEKAASLALPGGGQGWTHQDAAMGCIGELAERVSLWTRGYKDGRVFLGDEEQPKVAFADVIGLSDRQERAARERLQMEERGSTHDAMCWEGLSRRRVSLRNLTNNDTFPFPSIGILFKELEQITGFSLSFASSAGCAVWPTLKGARERALKELVERDAIAQAWYNRLGITLLREGFLSEILRGSLLEFLNQRSRHWCVFSVETDLEVHVALAVSHNGSGEHCVIGSAAAGTLVEASESALQEMLQAENSLALMDRAYPVQPEKIGSASRVPRQLAYARNRSIFNDLPLESAAIADESQAVLSFSSDDLLQSCFDRNLRIFEFDATREDLKIPCVKLVSPDLCTWEPRFGKRRLFEGVVERGLRAVPATEAEFASRPFPF